MKIIPLNDIDLIEEILNFKKFKAYLVGGCVRDWYLGKKCFDIDITFSDYPVDVAIFLSKKWNFEYQEFKNFLTIRLISKTRRIDLATFRKEIYLKPASLPKVEKALSIKEDLKRRDFTVNAIAISLNKDKYCVVDPFYGIKDIENKKIRVLHKKSFIDDPTRIFRAIRFAKRFGWEIEENTFELIKRDKKYIYYLSKERIRNEIIKILSEEKCYKMLCEIKKLNLLSKDEFFEFDKEIDNFKTLKERYIYIMQKNGISFFEKYKFERKIKKELKNLFSK